jgi:hypothetical protein
MPKITKSSTTGSGQTASVTSGTTHDSATLSTLQDAKNKWPNHTKKDAGMCRIVWDQMSKEGRESLALKSENDQVASLLSVWTRE